MIEELRETRVFMLLVGCVACLMSIGFTLWNAYGGLICDVVSRSLNSW